MSVIHYKFKANADYSSVKFDGLSLPLSELKRLIVQQKKLEKGPDYDFKITNAQTNEGTKFMLHFFFFIFHASFFFSMKLIKLISFIFFIQFSNK